MLAAEEIKEFRPQSPNKKRGGLEGLFEGLNIGGMVGSKSDRSATLQPASRYKARRARPLPPTPDLNLIEQGAAKSMMVEIPSDYEVKRTCQPNKTGFARISKLLTNDLLVPGWVRTTTKDKLGKLELYYINEDSQKVLRGCCNESKNIVGCCSLCDHKQWIFQGSEYDPSITILYAQMDGCIPSSVKLVDPKFIIPWRYRNRRTGAVSWKVIHLCGSNIEDAESETIILNINRDKKLQRIIETVRPVANSCKGAELVEYLLKVVCNSMGDYGLPRGATSSQADKSLYEQMKAQGHNFMMLGSVKIGLCRHKALLFKILCDYVGIECSLVTGYSTGGRHQWNIVELSINNKKENYIIDPTSPHFTWTKQGSMRMKAYKVNSNTSFGHGGITMKLDGIL